jgi:hypothetical protein
MNTFLLLLQLNEIQNQRPTVVLNTTNETVFTTDTPTLEFTGTDPEGNDICYEIQIRDVPFA